MKGVIITMLVSGGIMFGFCCLYHHTQKQMRQYEIEHNCRYDYNDLCYTQEQKPWLFHK